ncbi:MAG: response regulator [Thermodesulfovibrionales bacterium]|nr:response regulator [Thermodesulfovibrionales bacterium]
MSYKLLLADDSLTIQKVVDLVLAHEGFELKIVDDGEQALQVLESFSPAIVLADIEMPKMDGYQLCKNIRSNPLFSKIPIILLVGAFEPFDEQYARAVGADDFIVKPFESQELISKINVLLTRSEAAKEELFHPLVSDTVAHSGHEEQVADLAFASELKEFKKALPEQFSVNDTLLKMELPSKEEILEIIKTAIDDKISSLIDSDIMPRVLSAAEDAVRQGVSGMMPAIVENATKETMKNLVESMRSEIMRRLEELLQVWQKRQ